MPPVNPARYVGPMEIVPDGEYVLIPASSTTKAFGANGGAKGDALFGLLITPATTAPGVVTLFDGATSITIMVGGGTTNLEPIYVPLNIVSVVGAWNMTTGTNVTVIATGKFT